MARLRDEARGFEYSPLVSILMPIRDPEPRWLERALDSLMSQAYANWELCVCDDAPAQEPARGILSRYERLDGRIKVGHLERGGDTREATNRALSLAKGEYAGMLDHDDELAPHALFEVVKLLQERPEVDLVYSDEDRIDEAGNRHTPHFKPGWSPDLLLSCDYTSRFSLYRRRLLEEVGGLRASFDGWHGYDLALRFTERTSSIHHIPKVLYHRRGTPGEDSAAPVEGARRALAEALERRGVEGSVEDGLAPGSLRTKLKIEGAPKVSVIIPTRDNVSMLKRCVESIERLTTYPNYEILIVDNDSADPETLEYLNATSHRIVPFREEFNYSRINNFAVTRAGGEYILLLNDDTEVISAEWMEAMLEHAQRPEVGAVGAKLVYPNGRIQHAGVLTGVGSPWGPRVATHSHQHYPADSPGHAGALKMVRNYSAVTAACMMVRTSTFEEIGGLDEGKLRVSFNDVDLCLKLRARGYRIVYTPYAELHHYESASRPHQSDLEEILHMRERWGEMMDADPYYNPNFSLGSGDFNLRSDKLRPLVLLPKGEELRMLSEEAPLHPLLMEGAERRAYMNMQRANARNSRKTALVPAQAEKGLLPELLEATRTPGPSDNKVQPAMRSEAKGPPETRSEQLEAEQLIWIFGSPRTGSTWLSEMMVEQQNQVWWDEPYVGLLFGSFLYERIDSNPKLLEVRKFILGEPYRKVWTRSIRNFVLDGARARYRKLDRNQHVVVKEPNGSIGAPLIMGALPDSRMIFLLRDSRDVISSQLDASRKGSWSQQGRDLETKEKLEEFTRHLADVYLKVVSLVKEAYDKHPGPKVLIKYEDLRYNTLETMKDMYEALDVPVDQDQLRASVFEHGWEQLPDSAKGRGKFFRKAQPGSWTEELSSEQIKIIEDITGPMLSEFYQLG